MAQLVKLEPGDILLLTHMDSEVFEDLHINDAVRKFMAALKESLQLEAILCFEGDVDVSKVTGPEAATFVRGYINDRITAQEAAWRRGVEPGDGGE